MPGINPRLTLQTASLYASGDASTFSGTGGPFGFSPWTSQFGGTVSSAGLAIEPFNDTVYDVASGDELTFVVAVQNLQAAPAYTVRLRDVMPTGFVVPADGIGLSITDGAGTDLAYTGDLFGTSGLTLTAPIAAYDAKSGKNVALVTFSLAAGTALPGPYASLQSSATIDSYAATAGGTNLAPANPATANTTIVTAAPAPQVTAETDPSAVARGQTIAFDVTVSIPTGTLQDFTLAPILPSGAAALALVSSSIVSIGGALQTGTAYVGTDGIIHFGNVSYAGATGSNAITARILVRADGASSGAATLQTVISAIDPTSPGGRWSANVASSVGVVVPPAPATLAGFTSVQGVVPNTAVNPFASFVIGGDPAKTGTIAITIDSTVGRLGNPGPGSLDAVAGNYIASGTLAALQADARALTYTPAAPGTAHFTVTVIDSSGGIAQDASTTVTAQSAQPAPPPAPSPDPLFDSAYYLAHNPDVAAAGVDPYQHYMTMGWHEGRNPDAFFDTNFYLSHNPDVKAAGVNPLTHFETNGWREGRDPSLAFSDSAYLAHNQDVSAAGIDPLLHYVLFGQFEGRPAFLAGGTAPVDSLLDPAFYVRQLGATIDPTGLAAAQQASWSYHSGGGWQQGLNPNAFFDTNYYLSHNPDVAAAHIDPLQHYEQYGWKEGRDPSAAFSTNKYLAAYTDVRNAGLDPLQHYILYGATEGRTAFAA